jgi:hypothetical protein
MRAYQNPEPEEPKSDGGNPKSPSPPGEGRVGAASVRRAPAHSGGESASRRRERKARSAALSVRAIAAA